MAMRFPENASPTAKKWYQKGFEDGQTDQRVMILSFLQRKYMDMSISAEDPQMKAILEVVGVISEEFGNRGN